MAESIRAPRLLALFDGVPVPHVIDARITSTDYFSADWFQVGFAIASGGPDSLAYWTALGRPVVELRASVDGGATYASLILGKADTVMIDPVNRIARVEGRDLSSNLLDSRPYQAYPGQTSSSIVAAIAARHGLQARIKSTRGLAGRSFGAQIQETVLSQHSRVATDWDMVVRLAQRERYNAYVQARTLHFVPVDDVEGAEVPLSPADFSELQLEHNFKEEQAADLALASWNSQALRTLGLPLLGGTGGDVAIQPNLPATVAADMARDYTLARRRAARTLEGSMPGNVAIGARTRIRLSGVGGAYDRAYHVVSINRSFSPTAGFRQSIRGHQADI